MAMIGSVALLLVATTACGDAHPPTDQVGQGGGVTADAYSMDSKYVDGASAVSYTGQTMRHVLIQDMSAYVDGLTDRVDGNMSPPQTPAELLAALSYYHGFDGASSGQDSHDVVTTPAALQKVYDDIADGKDLHSKLAGNDDSTDHVDWDDGDSFVGWNDSTFAQHGGDTSTPEGLLMAMYNTLAWHVDDRINNGPQTEPGTSTPISAVYVTVDGRDLRQLIQKFLLMGVAYAQASDDYLDTATPGKGLLALNSQDGDKPYSALGHHWDEAFGYFGAAHDYPLYSDDEIAGKDGRPDWQGHHDTDADGAIDLAQEINWGVAVNAAKRDRGSHPSTPTDYTGEAFDAFLAGRLLILNADAELSADEVTDLTSYAHRAVDAWEKAIAATIVHYINDCVADTEAIDADPGDYSFVNHAKHWSEMKGFALGLQFNPRSKVDPTAFAQLHDLVGDAPVLATASVAQRSQYVSDLLAARDILELAYGFAPVNVEQW